MNKPKFKLTKPLTAALIMLALAVVLTVISSFNRPDIPEPLDETSHGREVKVSRVIDGDTLDVTWQGKPERVRLSGIDAPERSQPYGEASRHRLAQWVEGQTVCITNQGADPYGRTLAYVYATERAPVIVPKCGLPINHLMVQQGAAWVYRYHGHAADPSLEPREDQAKQQRAGLWADDNPVAPWVWRQQHKKDSTQ